VSEPTGLSQSELLDLFDRCEAHPTIRAAITGILQPGRAEPRAEGLDVERLAEALHRAVVTGYGESACGGKGGVDDPLVFHLGEARAIAREYAALEEPTP